MTEKRYDCKWREFGKSGNVWDNENPDEFMNVQEVCDLLNEQHETITDLEEKEIELGRNYLIKLEFEQKVKDTLQKHYKLYTNMAVELRHDKYSNGTCHTVLEVLEEIADELGIEL